MTSVLWWEAGGEWRDMGSGLEEMVQGGLELWEIGGEAKGLSWVVKKVVVAWRTPAGSVLGGALGWVGCITCWRGGISEVCGLW